MGRVYPPIRNIAVVAALVGKVRRFLLIASTLEFLVLYFGGNRSGRIMIAKSLMSWLLMMRFDSAASYALSCPRHMRPRSTAKMGTSEAGVCDLFPPRESNSVRLINEMLL